MDAAVPRRTPPAAVLALVGVSLLGLALRLWIGWWMGHLGDLRCFQMWSLDPGELHLQGWYSAEVIGPRNYPPLYPSVLRVMRWVHRGLNLPGQAEYPLPIEYHFHEDPPRWRPLMIWLKLPAIVADLCTGVLLFLLGRHLRGPWLGVGLAALYLFSPAILYDGAYYGQTDTILITFLVAAFLAWTLRRPAWLGAMLMGASLMKAQAIFALPVFAAALIGDWRTWRPLWARFIMGALAALAAVLALAWWTGQIDQFYRGYVGIVGFYPRTTLRAMNFWWLVTRPWHKAPVQADFPLDNEPVFLSITYAMIGAALFFTALGLILWRLHRAGYTTYALALALAGAGWAFFNLPTQMHERYSVPAVGLMCLLPVWSRKWWGIALLTSTLGMLNIAEVCPFIFPPSKFVAFLVNTFIYSEMQATWTLFAIIHALMVPLMIDALWREDLCRKGPRGPSAGFPVAGPANGATAVGH